MGIFPSYFVFTMPAWENVPEADKTAAIEACREHGSKSRAHRAGNMSLGTLNVLIADDPEFSARWEEAREEFTAKLEEEAYRRAVEGWDEDKMGGQGVIYQVRKYDSGLLQLLLRANSPGKYKEQIKVENHVHKTEIGVADLSPEKRAKLREILDGESPQ